AAADGEAADADGVDAAAALGGGEGRDRRGAAPEGVAAARRRRGGTGRACDLPAGQGRRCPSPHGVERAYRQDRADDGIATPHSGRFTLAAASKQCYFRRLPRIQADLVPDLGSVEATACRAVTGGPQAGGV